MKSLKEQCISEIYPKLKDELGLGNIHEIPMLKKVIINVGLGDAATNAKLLDESVKIITLLTGQKPLLTRAKKSIAGFKIREGMPIGMMVTLRGDRMFDFVAKLLGVVLPRIRDFRGISVNAFDGRGNYNLGLKEQLLFPEVDYDMVTRFRGMNISFVTSASDNEQALALFTHMGFPFTKQKTSA
jgi:large subunit ribosomal protein L5